MDSLIRAVSLSSEFTTQIGDIKRFDYFITSMRTHNKCHWHRTNTELTQSENVPNNQFGQVKLLYQEFV